MVAVALREGRTSGREAPAPDRRDILARYRRLREISKVHYDGALRLVTGEALREQGRRLGLMVGNTLVLDGEGELTLVADLAIYTAPPGRSRAIDRYARSAHCPPRSDEAAVLNAMCKARFGIFVVQRRHPSAGTILTDMFRETELWLVDEGLEASLPEGAGHAMRYYAPESFAMTAGVGMPIDGGLLENVLDSVPFMRRKSPVEAIDDRRFAEALYRESIATGVMERVAYRDVEPAAL